jgi:hypothetical protein
MKERSREEIIARTTTHGGGNTPEYSVWCGMKRRCENPNERSFKNYGGRGIQVLFRSFEDFIAEVGPRPSPSHMIGRIENDRHYEPGNVRWETPIDQARNKRTTLLVTVDGLTASLAEHCEARGVRYQKAWLRINRYGWSPDRALGVS